MPDFRNIPDKWILYIHYPLHGQAILPGCFFRYLTNETHLVSNYHNSIKLLFKPPVLLRDSL